MRIIGEKFWVTMLFWVLLVIVIGLIIYFMVARAMKPPEDKPRPDWYMEEMTMDRGDLGSGFAAYDSVLIDTPELKT